MSQKVETVDRSPGTVAAIVYLHENYQRHNRRDSLGLGVVAAVSVIAYLIFLAIIAVAKARADLVVYSTLVAS